MTWYFKKSKLIMLLLYAIGIISIAIFIPVVSKNKLIYIVIFFVAVFVWFSVSTAIPRLYSERKMDEISKILYDKCDVKQYIETIDNIINIGIKSGHNVTRLLLYKSFGLFSDGKLNDAWNILKNIKGFTDNAYGCIDRVIYFGTYFALYLENNELDSAEKALNDMKNAIDKSKHIRTLQKSLYNLYTESKLRLETEKENSNNYELKYIKIFKNASNNLQRVNVKFKLGQIYFNTGRNNQAKEAFEYVIQNGNTLYFVQEAKEYLSKIGQVS